MDKQARIEALRVRVNQQNEKVAELICADKPADRETRLLMILTRHLLTKELCTDATPAAAESAKAEQGLPKGIHEPLHVRAIVSVVLLWQAP
jgi:hypothetical protein